MSARRAGSFISLVAAAVITPPFDTENKLGRHECSQGYEALQGGDLRQSADRRQDSRIQSASDVVD